MTKITLKAKDVAAIAQFASTDPTRYYLDGIYVEPTDDGHTLTATDGHVMGSLTRPGKLDCCEAFILSTPKELIAACKKRDAEYIRFELGKLGATFNVEILNKADFQIAAVLSNTIDGTYPEWRKCMPDTNKMGPVDEINFNPRLLSQFGAALKILSGVKEVGIKVRFPANKHNPMAVDFGSADVDFRGALMPMRV